jgi:hypothetical protein
MIRRRSALGRRASESIERLTCTRFIGPTRCRGRQDQATLHALALFCGQEVLGRTGKSGGIVHADVRRFMRRAERGRRSVRPAAQKGFENDIEGHEDGHAHDNQYQAQGHRTHLFDCDATHLVASSLAPTCRTSVSGCCRRSAKRNSRLKRIVSWACAARKAQPGFRPFPGVFARESVRSVSWG